MDGDRLSRRDGEIEFDGPRGNERLTAQAGVVLFVLLAALGVTIPILGPLLAEHVFLGMMLIPPVLVKMGSTGYRFIRYYTGARAYRTAGPPKTLPRLIAPLVVLSTLAVFGSGIMLLVDGPGSGLMRGVHKVAFVIWFGVTSLHVLNYVWRTPRLAAADWRATGDSLGGSFTRRLLVGGSVAAGIVLAWLTVGYARAWPGG